MRDLIQFLAVMLSPIGGTESELKIFSLIHGPVTAHGYTFSLYIDEEEKPDGVVHLKRDPDDRLACVLNRDMQCLQIDGLVVVCGKDLMQVQIKILKEWMKARKINPNDVFQVPIEFWK